MNIKKILFITSLLLSSIVFATGQDLENTEANVNPGQIKTEAAAEDSSQSVETDPFNDRILKKIRDAEVKYQLLNQAQENLVAAADAKKVDAEEGAAAGAGAGA